MFEELNKNIANAKEKLRRKEKLKNLLERTREDLNVQTAKKKELHKILHKEGKDVEKLESLSITGLFYSILGDKEQQLEKERQEYLSAKLKYDECCSLITTLEKEIISYNEELREYINIESEYDELMASKEELILQGNDLNAEKLISLAEKAQDLKSNIKETKEAINAGEKVREALERVLSSLESAKGWGQWDMLGGGVLSTMAKHSKMDEAKSHVHEVQRLLGIFKRELSDIRLSSNIDINIGSFEKFADYFFDGLIFDWVVQSKINDSLDNVRTNSNNVKKLLSTLERNLNDCERELMAVEEEIKGIIEEKC
ncbi:hypothetical protein KQI86_07035 [Clostridium sp. MSJ-11]|uniref:Uncharacterized protein n=1 Tax=Clostridium mobile TaxID=2841512 RepID=A0ABS6EFT7_9CLOT|nr:hypothetical protein [Clostridium mobile]MBU5484081.1 hypothetical protein [Clostridium mobile]